MRTFKLNDNEEKAFQEFYKKHEKCREKAVGRFGQPLPGTYSFIFTPTGIGNAVECQCNICNKKEDITDVSSW